MINKDIERVEGCIDYDLWDDCFQQSWDNIKKFIYEAHNTKTQCQCGADAVYHYCHICWCMEIDSQKQADTSHVD